MKHQPPNVKSRPAKLAKRLWKKIRLSGNKSDWQLGGGVHEVEHAACENEVDDRKGHGMSELGVCGNFVMNEQVAWSYFGCSLVAEVLSTSELGASELGSSATSCVK